MTLQVPSLLMLLGAALLAVAIFAPGPARGVVPAPPSSAGAAQAADWTMTRPTGICDMAASGIDGLGGGPPAWPSRFDPRAAGCDPAARIELIAGLAGVGAGWSDAVLQAAFDEETDPAVRRALDDLTARRTGADELPQVGDRTP